MADSSELNALLADLAPVLDAPLLGIAEELWRVVEPITGGSSLLIFTEDCTGRPQKKAGDAQIIADVTIAELDAVRRALPSDSPVWRRAVLGGAERHSLQMRAATGALLVITDPVLTDDTSAHSPAESAPTASRPSASSARLSPGPADGAALVHSIWELAATRIRQHIQQAPPSYLRESRVVSTERNRVTAELSERHATQLEGILSALRSHRLSDQAARTTAGDLAATALVELRTRSDRMIALSEEPVHRAFERLRSELRPLVRFGGVDVEFVEPPVNGRALPGEVAHAARAVVRATILLLNDQEDLSRIRIQWDCDGDNLLITIRDDGPGHADALESQLPPIEQRVSALDGEMSAASTVGWGTELTVRIPLDPPKPVDASDDRWGLVGREWEVLRELAAGKRNRQIAADLGISENTVKFHLGKVFRKLGVHSRAEAIATAQSAL